MAGGWVVRWSPPSPLRGWLCQDALPAGWPLPPFGEAFERAMDFRAATGAIGVVLPDTHTHTYTAADGSGSLSAGCAPQSPIRRQPADPPAGARMPDTLADPGWQGSGAERSVEALPAGKNGKVIVSVV